MNLFNKLMPSNEGQKAKVVAFLNQKGGVGKTTLAFNTARALSDKGLKVLVIDMDPQANLSLLCNVELEEGDRNIYHLLVNSVRELKALHTDVLLDDVLVKSETLDLLPAGQELSGFDVAVSGIQVPRQFILKKLIEKNALRERYDVIIIDSPPTLGLLVVNILCATDGLIVPFKPDEFSKKGLGHLYQVLGDIEDMGVPLPEIITHVPNLVEARRKQSSDELMKIRTELEAEFGESRLFDPIVNRLQLGKALQARKSVFDYQSKEYLPIKEQFGALANLITEFNA